MDHGSHPPTIDSPAAPRLTGAVIPPDAAPAARETIELLAKALAPSFVLVRHIGSGGMGDVYLARDPVLKRLVAVKVLSADYARDPEARARFEREAQSVAAISHPNVVAVYSVGELSNGVPYFVMQHANGRSMAERIAQDGPLDMATAKQVLGEVASALEAAHRQRIIHRDIKPSNILWDDTSGRALVSDFGIAAVLERPDEREPTRITQTGMAVGTPAYMSPEQLLAERVTEKTDIYSLGLLGYELLTAKGPYQISSPRELLAAHLRDAPAKLTTVLPDIDPEVANLLEACLSKNPQDRPSAADVAKRLARGTAVVLEWPPPGLESMHGRLARPVTQILTGSVLVTLPVLALVFSNEPLVASVTPPFAALASLASIGVALYVMGLSNVLRRITGATRAIHAGYGWWTVAEVLADSRRDTGALIAGAREYAALPEARRSRFRVLRLWSAGLELGAAAVPPIAFCASLPLRLGSHGPHVLLWMMLILPAVAMLAAQVLRSREGDALKETRKRLGRQVSEQSALATLAQAWTAAFEQVRRGQRLGTGVVGRSGVVAGVGAGVLAVAVLSVFAAYGSTIVSEAGRAVFLSSQFRTASIHARQRRFARILAYRVPVNPSITPLQAGDALHSIDWLSMRTTQPFTAEETTPSRVFSGKWDFDPIGTRPAEFPPLGPKRFWMEEAIIQARHGLTPAQRSLLTRMAAFPAADAFTTMAYAGSIDYWGAAVKFPLPDTFPAEFLPVPHYVYLKKGAYARVARAALDMADGKPKDAERDAREIIGAGAVLEQDRTIIGNIIGEVTMGIGRSALSAVFEATGRPTEAHDVSADADPQESGSELLTEVPTTLDAEVALLRATVKDTLELTGLRWEFAHTLSSLPCTDARQLLFGPDSASRADMAAGRQLLVRRGSDSAIYALFEQSLSRPIPPVKSNDPSETFREGAPAVKLARVLAGGLDGLVGSKRFWSCLMRVSR